ncbi:hypothetical protein DID75_05215 [Candidatus Marinamargulisbacteria bacterium SCGC AG-410-N11]|nr:hypothetical protein DID75_05215 [Candidatus Marinamargulisbacteria bacterium SCGC AG-410-N11]
MKNFVKIFLILILTFGLASCSEKIQNTQTSNQTSVISSTTEVFPNNSSKFVITQPWGSNGSIDRLSFNSDNNITIQKNILEISENPSDAVWFNNKLYITHSKNHNLIIFNPELNTLEEVSLKKDPEDTPQPQSIAIYKDKGFIANFNKNSVYVIDINKDVNVITNEITLPENNDLKPYTDKITKGKPQKIILANNKLYLLLPTWTDLDSANGNWAPGGPSLVIVIDPELEKIEKTITLSHNNPTNLIKKDNYLLVLQTGENWPADHKSILEVIDLNTNEVLNAQYEIKADTSSMILDAEGNILVASSYSGTFIEKISFKNNTFSKESTIEFDNLKPGHLLVNNNDLFMIASDSNFTSNLYKLENNIPNKIETSPSPYIVK